MSKERRFNYGETFCDAVDIILSEKLKLLSYDVTKVCTIVDNVYKNLGRYTVQEETIKYEAYSANTEFKVGDTVLVVIPNGDYNMQKMILSKVALDEDLTTAANYEPPLSKMLDFTGNIISETLEFSLLANDPDRKEVQIYSIDWNNNTGDSYSGYTHMGISADFQTWLSELGAISGDYGLSFRFYNYDSITSDTTDEESEPTYSLNFDVMDILGNPYNFESYVNQLKVFDISFLKDVTRLDIFFVLNGEFRDANRNLIDHIVTAENTFGDEFSDDIEFEPGLKLNDNLFVNNLKIYLGYDINAFSGDELRISTNDPSTYSATLDSNNKRLILKWIHKTEDGKYVLLDNTSEDVLIYWVRYGDTQAAIESIAGRMWTLKNFTADPLNPFNSILDIDANLTNYLDILVKAIGRIYKSDGNWALYESKILTFTNSDPHVDETTFNAATKLSIKCMDNSEGNYFKYNLNSELINEGEGLGYLRTLSIYYLGISLKDNVNLTPSRIEWTIPVNTENNNSYTMLHWDTIETNENISIQDNGNELIIIFNNLRDGEDIGYHLKYSIANTWFTSNSHNTIKCKVSSKDNVIYEASKTLMFGKANSQGSNLSLILQFTDNKNAYTVTTSGNNSVLSRPQMVILGLIYDLNGNPLDASTTGWTWIDEDMPDFDCVVDLSDKSKIKITMKSSVTNLSVNLYNVLACKYALTGLAPVIAYYPIAIKVDETYNMDGARKVIYNSAGVPSYSTTPYVLRDEDNNPIGGVTWTLYPGGDNYPTLEPTANGELALKANPVYIKDYDYKTIVVAKSGSRILWILPVLIMQSAYDFAILNQWNGTSVLSDNNRVVAGIIAAGKKDSDNTFSGVILGDIEESEDGETYVPARTGLYGILKGITTFSLTDSGNATFEYTMNNSKNVMTSTQIHFGEGNTLCSNTIDDNRYLTLDLDDLYFELKSKTNNTSLLLSSGDVAGYENTYLHFLKNNGIIMTLGTNNNYLLSSDYGDSNGKGLRINLGTKKIIGNADAELTWKGPMIINSDNFVKIDTRSTTNNVFLVGNLKVDKDGEVYYGDKTLAEYIKEIANNNVLKEK